MAHSSGLASLLVRSSTCCSQDDASACWWAQQLVRKGLHSQTQLLPLNGALMDAREELQGATVNGNAAGLTLVSKEHAW